VRDWNRNLYSTYYYNIRSYYWKLRQNTRGVFNVYLTYLYSGSVPVRSNILTYSIANDDPRALLTFTYYYHYTRRLHADHNAIILLLLLYGRFIIRTYYIVRIYYYIYTIYELTILLIIVARALSYIIPNYLYYI